MLVKRGVGKSKDESRAKLRSLLPGLKERYPEALDQSQWEGLVESLESSASTEHQ